MYKRKGLKHKVYKQWHGPARVIGRAIAEEHELMLEDDDTMLPKNGQQGFLDLSKAQDPGVEPLQWMERYGSTGPEWRPERNCRSPSEHSEVSKERPN